jgi:3-dehydroquinate synthase
MIAASRLAELTGTISADVTTRQRELLRCFGLPVAAPGLDVDALIRAMGHDKKAKAGRIRFVLPRSIGEVEFVAGVEDALLRGVLAEMTLQDQPT